MADRIAYRVALVVDHPDRDLPGLVLVALDLARRGVACHLVPMNLQEREIWAIEPDFVLFNYLRKSNEAFARQLLAAGIAFGVMDTEGAIWSSPEEYASLLWTDEALRRQARCVCMWGASLAEHVVSRGLFACEQVVVTGCPRFDLYAEPWRRLRDDADDALMQVMQARRRILINTNFSVSNPRFTTAGKCVLMHHDVLGYSYAELRRVVDAEAAAICEVVRMAGRLGELFPTTEIVIRPHPFEDPSPYEAVPNVHGNVRVNQSESIQAAIFGACAVIQRSCTTAVEAGLAGVPAFSPQWIDAPFLMPLAESASVPCASFDDLVRQLTAIIDGTYRAPGETSVAVADVVRECCATSPADGMSHERVGEAVFRALAGLAFARVDHDHCLRHLYGLGNGHDEHALTRAARHARHRLGLSPEWSFMRMREVPAMAWMHGRKHFDAADVRQIVQRARALDPLKQSGHVRAGSGGQARYGVAIGATAGASP